MACDHPVDFSNYTLDTFNQTLLNDTSLCNSCICPLVLDGVQLANVQYFPTLAGNALYVAIFGILLIIQVFFGIRFKTWGFMIGMFGGLVLEVLGYAARIGMRFNMFQQNFFIMYLVALTIAPAFFSASIYLTLSRLITMHSTSRARFRPQIYTYLFIGFDFFALLLQAVGGAMASTADSGSDAQHTGVNVMIAGVAWQVVSLGFFFILSGDFYFRVRNLGNNQLNPRFAEVRSQRTFNYFQYAVFVAATFVFVRSVFRCAELSDGFDGKLANEEVTFMILEGVMIILAIGLLTIFHPGWVFGAEGWRAASWKGKKGVSEEEVLSGQTVMYQPEGAKRKEGSQLHLTDYQGYGQVMSDTESR